MRSSQELIESFLGSSSPRRPSQKKPGVFSERAESLLTEGHMIFSQEIIGSVLWSSLIRLESLFSEAQKVFSKEASVFSERPESLLGEGRRLFHQEIMESFLGSSSSRRPVLFSEDLFRRSKGVSQRGHEIFSEKAT